MRNEGSEATKAIENTKKQYEIYVNDKSNLLGHLRELTRLLRFNSVQGTGSETNAGAGTYAAIINFNEYYQQLDESEKDKIPKPVKEEIDLLLELTTNPQKNVNATENLETCTATRRDKLSSAILEHEAELSAIALSGGRKNELIKKTKDQFTDSVQSFVKTLQDGTYIEGKDSPHLTLSLINTLNVELSVSSFEDLQHILALNAEEISEICQEKSLAEQITNQLSQLGDLQIILVETAPEKLNVLLSATSQGLSEKLSMSDIAALLSFIHMDADRVAILVKTMIKSGNDLSFAMDNLSDEERTVIAKGIIKHVQNIIQEAKDDSSIVEALGLLDAILDRERTRDVIKNQVLELLSQPDVDINKQKKMLITAASMGNTHMLELLLTAPQFSDSFKNGTTVLDEAINTDKLKNLPASSIDVLVSHMDKDVERITTLVKKTINSSVEGFTKLLNLISIENQVVVITALEDRFSDVISSSGDLDKVLRATYAENQVMVLTAIQGRLPHMISSTKDLIEILGLIEQSKESQIMVLTALKGSFSDLIHSTKDLTQLFDLIPEEGQAIVCTALREDFPKIISSAQAFIKIALSISVENQSIVVSAMKKDLSKIISTTDEFINVLTSIASVQGPTGIFAAMQGRFSQVVKSRSDLDVINSGYLDQEMCSAITTEVITHVQNVIQNPPDDHVTIETLVFLRDLLNDESSGEANKELFQTFLGQSDFDINRSNKEGNTVLVIAARTGNKDVLELLLIDPHGNISRNNAKMALDEAIAAGNKGCALAIMNRFADTPDVVDYLKSGMDPAFLFDYMASAENREPYTQQDFLNAFKSKDDLFKGFVAYLQNTKQQDKVTENIDSHIRLISVISSCFSEDSSQRQQFLVQELKNVQPSQDDYSGYLLWIAMHSFSPDSGDLEQLRRLLIQSNQDGTSLNANDFFTEQFKAVQDKSVLGQEFFILAKASFVQCFSRTPYLRELEEGFTRNGTKVDEHIIPEALEQIQIMDKNLRSNHRSALVCLTQMIIRSALSSPESEKMCSMIQEALKDTLFVESYDSNSLDYAFDSFLGDGASIESVDIYTNLYLFSASSTEERKERCQKLIDKLTELKDVPRVQPGESMAECFILSMEKAKGYLQLYSQQLKSNQTKEPHSSDMAKKALNEMQSNKPQETRSSVASKKVLNELKAGDAQGIDIQGKFSKH